MAVTDIIEWTPEQVAYLKLHYGKRTREKIARDLGTSLGSVSGKARRLGLRSAPVGRMYNPGDVVSVEAARKMSSCRRSDLREQGVIVPRFKPAQPNRSFDFEPDDVRVIRAAVRHAADLAASGGRFR